MESIGAVRLMLESGYVLQLRNVFYVPNFRRNLISISVLNHDGYVFLFQNASVQLSLNSKVVGSSILNNGLFQLLLSPTSHQSFAVESSVSKRSLCAENSCLLWHKRLGHISRERIQRLVKNNILPSLDFGDMGT